jgi:hypothetical protein
MTDAIKDVLRVEGPTAFWKGIDPFFFARANLFIPCSLVLFVGGVPL